MGTNYYLVDESCKCEHCGRGTEKLHIGKSSYGWHFALHIIPKKKINNLEDWIKEFTKENTYIIDEYDDSIDINKMLDIITNRSSLYGFDKFTENEEKLLHEANFSERGGNGLLRHKIVNNCVGHGDGTYDYFINEFS